MTGDDLTVITCILIAAIVGFGLGYQCAMSYAQKRVKKLVEDFRSGAMK